jgi:hypothetical protein
VTSRSHFARLEPITVVLSFALAALWTLARFNSNLVQSGDALISYLPGAIAARRLDPEGFRIAMSFGVEARPPIFPLLIALVPAPVVEGAHLLVALFGALAGVLAWRLLRRWLPTALALSGSAILIFSPPILPYTVNTAPDVLFLCIACGLVWAILEQRTWLMVLMYGLAVFSRGNGYLLAPLFLVHVYDRRNEWRRMLGPVLAAACVFGLRGAYQSWVKPNALGVGEVGAHFWHASIFPPGATGATFGERFQLWSIEQWWLVFVRTFAGAPTDLAKHFFSDQGVTHYAGGLLFIIAALAFVAFGSRRYLGAGFLFYGPLAVFHWETRYFIPIYAGLFLGGFVLLARRFFTHRLAVLVISAVALGEALVSLHGLDRQDWRRNRLGFDDSGSVLHPVDIDAREVLAAVMAQSERRPVRLYGCLYLPMMLFNHVRFDRYYDQIECADENHQNPRAWTDLDAAFMDEQRAFTSSLVAHLVDTGTVALTYAGRYRLYRNLHPGYDLTRPGYTPLSLLVQKQGSNHAGWTWVVHAPYRAREGELVVTRFFAESDGPVHNLRFGYFDGAEIYEPGVLKFINTPVHPGERTVPHLCTKPTCEVAFMVQTFNTRNARFEIKAQGIYPPLAR